MEILKTPKEVKKTLRKGNGYFLWNEEGEENEEMTVVDAMEDGCLIMISKAESNLIMQSSKKAGLKMNGTADEMFKMDYTRNEAEKLRVELSKIDSGDKALHDFVSKGAFRFMLPATLKAFF